MTILIALSLFAPGGSLGTERSPYVYRPVVETKSTYAARFFIESGGSKGSLAYTLSLRPVRVQPDGSARIEFSPSKPETTGLAKDETLDLSPYQIDMDRYGFFQDVKGLSDHEKLLAMAFPLPAVALTKDRWTGVENVLPREIGGAVLESRIKSVKDGLVVFLTRDKVKDRNSGFSRETTFDSRRGRLVSVRVRWRTETGASVGIDLDRQKD